MRNTIVAAYNASTEGCFLLSFGWNWPSGSGEEEENVISLRQQQQWRTTEIFWSEKLTWAFSSGKLKNNYFWRSWKLAPDLNLRDNLLPFWYQQNTVSNLVNFRKRVPE